MSYPRASLTGGFAGSGSPVTPPLIPSVPPLPRTVTIAPIPVLCRDPAHASFVQPSAFTIPTMYLAWVDSGIDNAGNMQPVAGALDDDGDLIVRLPPSLWQMIRNAFVPPAPVVLPIQDFPLLTHVPIGDNLTFLCFGIQQDYTFRVNSDFPYDYVTGSTAGIRLRRRGATSSIVHSSHPNHRFSSNFRITFLA